MCLLNVSVSFCILFSLPFQDVRSQSVVERTNSMSLLLASIQCLPSSENGESASQLINDINTNFDPEYQLDIYKNPKDMENLLNYIKNVNKSGNHERNDDPFTNSPEHISQLGLIMNVLYPNSDNWPLFYNTSAWLLHRVNSAQLWWALMIVCGEKFDDTIVVPTAVEVFPQLFVKRIDVLKAAGLTASNQNDSSFPLQYWNSDPGLNEFHTHWHIDNPFWWDEKVYGVPRYRRGELFMYMHHQLVNRYNAELLSNGIPEFTPLELDPGYQFPEGYIPDIVNINYETFPVRKKGDRFRDWDDGEHLAQLKTWHDRLYQGIEQGYFKGPQGNQISLQRDNNSDILGNTVESSTVHSANMDYYGSFHNYLHRELAGSFRPHGNPGVEAHSETAIRDPVFFRLHTKVDTLYMQLKSHASPYPKVAWILFIFKYLIIKNCSCDI